MDPEQLANTGCLVRAVADRTLLVTVLGVAPGASLGAAEPIGEEQQSLALMSDQFGLSPSWHCGSVTILT